MLHARVVPTGKGDTMICNMYRAWDTLSPGMQRMLDGMKAWHSGAATQRRNNLEHNDGNEIKNVPTPRLHPVVRTNPDNGRKALFVNPHFTTTPPIWISVSIVNSGFSIEHKKAKYIHLYPTGSLPCARR